MMAEKKISHKISWHMLTEIKVLFEFFEIVPKKVVNGKIVIRIF